MDECWLRLTDAVNTTDGLQLIARIENGLEQDDVSGFR